MKPHPLWQSTYKRQVQPTLIAMSMPAQAQQIPVNIPPPPIVAVISSTNAQTTHVSAGAPPPFVIPISQLGLEPIRPQPIAPLPLIERPLVNPLPQQSSRPVIPLILPTLASPLTDTDSEEKESAETINTREYIPYASVFKEEIENENNEEIKISLDYPFMQVDQPTSPEEYKEMWDDDLISQPKIPNSPLVISPSISNDTESPLIISPTFSQASNAGGDEDDEKNKKLGWSLW